MSANIDLKAQDERAAFEQYAAGKGWSLSPDQNNCGIVVAERYGHPQVQRAWEVWQARAALAAAPAATQEVQDAQPVAILRREIGESSWFDHTPVRPGPAEHQGLITSAEWDYCPVHAAPQPAAEPETTAEQFIQAAIDRAPDPLRRLGEWLSTVLDEDQWATAERLLLGAATPPRPSGDSGQVAGGQQGGST